MATVGFGAIVLAIGMLAMAVGVRQEITGNEPDKIGQLTAMAVILVLMAFAAVVLGLVAARISARRRSPKDLYRLVHFAAANGLTYVPGVQDGRYLRPWAERGTLRVVEALGTRQGRAVEFGNYELTAIAGLGGRSTTFGGYAVTRVQTPLPHIRLESRRVKRLSVSGSATRDQHLSLEGDFERTFTLLCPAGYERDALYLFTPDVMARLMDAAGDFDVELIDDWVFLSSPRDVVTLDPARWDTVVGAVDAVVSKIRQWEQWRDDRVPENHLQERGQVAQGGQRLRIGVGGGTILTVIGVFAALSAVILTGAI